MFTINDAILNPYTRAEGVQQLAAWISAGLTSGIYHA